MQLQACGLDCRAEGTCNAGRESPQIDRGALQRETVCFDPVEFQQRVDQAQHAPAVAPDHFEICAQCFISNVAGTEAIVERPQHEREWRAKLMADVVEEVRFYAIEFGERLRTLARFPLAQYFGGRLVDGAENAPDHTRVFDGAVRERKVQFFRKSVTLER